MVWKDNTSLLVGINRLVDLELPEAIIRMDIKKILFKFGDKIIFVVFLALFLLSALKLVSNQGNNGNSGVIGVGAPQATADMDILARAEFHILKSEIEDPPISYTGGGIAEDPDWVEPVEGKEKACPRCFRIVPIEMEKCPECGNSWGPTNDDDRDGMPNDWEDKYDVTDRKVPDAQEDPDADGYTNIEEYHGNSDPGDPKSIPKTLVIVEIGREPVDILFRGYIVNEGGDPEKPDPLSWVLQINWGKYADTSFIPYGGYFRGYRMYPLAKKIETTWNPAIGENVTEDIWALTIQKKNRQPIYVIKDKTALEQEAYAILRITSGPDKDKRIDKLYDTEKFTANGIEYTVLSVAAEEKQVILMDAKGNTIRLNK